MAQLLYPSRPDLAVLVNANLLDSLLVLKRLPHQGFVVSCHHLVVRRLLLLIVRKPGLVAELISNTRIRVLRR